MRKKGYRNAVSQASRSAALMLIMRRDRQPIICGMLE
jgi:hypothetical protein